MAYDLDSLLQRGSLQARQQIPLKGRSPSGGCTSRTWIALTGTHPQTGIRLDDRHAQLRSPVASRIIDEDRHLLPCARIDSSMTPTPGGMPYILKPCSPKAGAALIGSHKGL